MSDKPVSVTTDIPLAFSMVIYRRGAGSFRMKLVTAALPNQASHPDLNLLARQAAQEVVSQYPGYRVNQAAVFSVMTQDRGYFEEDMELVP
jgi:hypothetical protein